MRQSPFHTFQNVNLKCYEPHLVWATQTFFLSTITASFLREEQLLHSLSEVCVSGPGGN